MHLVTDYSPACGTDTLATEPSRTCCSQRAMSELAARTITTRPLLLAATVLAGAGVTTLRRASLALGRSVVGVHTATALLQLAAPPAAARVDWRAARAMVGGLQRTCGTHPRRAIAQWVGVRARQPASGKGRSCAPRPGSVLRMLLMPPTGAGRGLGRERAGGGGTAPIATTLLTWAESLDLILGGRRGV